MRFINSLRSIEGVSIYPIITLILFMTIFILAVILIFSKSKKTINEIKRIPLDDNQDESLNIHNQQ
ncbi:MAG: cbb3-type cytochrome c oxidase subunit 3 [Bacteroidia bacterium]|nr:cbb3-type cytochrome c oxidase subunit 3 [Bacteroidia bacterium]